MEKTIRIQLKKGKEKMENEIEKVTDDRVVDINSIVDALQREGRSTDEIVAKLKELLKEGKITEADFRAKVDDLEKKERAEASKLFDMKFQERK